MAITFGAIERISHGTASAFGSPSNTSVDAPTSNCGHAVHARRQLAALVNQRRLNRTSCPPFAASGRAGCCPVLPPGAPMMSTDGVLPGNRAGKRLMRPSAQPCHSPAMRMHTTQCPAACSSVFARDAPAQPHAMAAAQRQVAAPGFVCARKQAVSRKRLRQRFHLHLTGNPVEFRRPRRRYEHGGALGSDADFAQFTRQQHRQFIPDALRKAGGEKIACFIPISVYPSYSNSVSPNFWYSAQSTSPFDESLNVSRALSNRALLLRRKCRPVCRNRSPARGASAARREPYWSGRRFSASADCRPVRRTRRIQ